MRILPILLLVTVLCGCAGGPTHDYYNPIAVDGRRFDGPITMEHAPDLKEAVKNRIKEGYTVIGNTDYGGKMPEAVELKAQARRVHANHVVYCTDWIPAKEGSWHFSMGGWGSGGGTDNGNYGVHIVFMGRR